MMDEICLLGKKRKKYNINSQTEGTQRLVSQACSSAISHLVQLESRLPQKIKKGGGGGSWEPRGHPSMRAADLQTELSDYENTTALRNALKSIARLQRFPMQLQRLCVHTHAHTQNTSVPPFTQGLQFLSFITSKDLTRDL